MMTTLVLVPGGWLGAWAWTRVVPALSAAGHEAVPVTLPGLAERKNDMPAASIDISTQAADVAGLVARRDLTDVVLVGHSFGGAVIGPIADRIPERVARLVHLTGTPLPTGRSLFDLIGPEGQKMMEGMAIAAGDPDRLPVVSDELLDTVLHPKHGMDDQARAWFREHATSHPLASYRERVTLTGKSDAIPRAFVHCVDDGPAPIDPHDGTWDDYVEIASGHWPMFTVPEVLAEVLAGQASKIP